MHALKKLYELVLGLTPVHVCGLCTLNRTECYIDHAAVCVLTGQRLEDDSVGAGVSVRLPLGAQAGHPHLVYVQVGHPQVHCRKEREESLMVCFSMKSTPPLHVIACLTEIINTFTNAENNSGIQLLNFSFSLNIIPSKVWVLTANVWVFYLHPSLHHLWQNYN